MKYLVALIALVLIPAAAHAQRDVVRRTYPFLEDRLIVAVHAEAPGELQVVRGQRGRLEVAARSRDGFAGFGLGGDITRQLRLTAVGSDAVSYLVVVPEHVAVSVVLPSGGSSDLGSREGVSSYRWGDIDASEPMEPLPATRLSGLYILHSGRGRTPRTVDVPDLGSVRSISVRIEGDDFQVAATRPLSLRPGSPDHFEVRVTGEPVDVVLYLPRGTSGFQLRAAGRAVAQVVGGRAEGLCGGTLIQRPTPSQEWLTLFPRDGAIPCR